MSKYILEEGTILYHGTIHDFEMNDINMPCWFSKFKEQAINHVRYKHYGHPNGFLLTYRIKNPITLYDISNDGDIRMEINAYGNYSIANKFYTKQYGDEYSGYINLPEQGEIMIIRRLFLEPLNKINIELNKEVIYCNIDGQNWRMREKNKKKRINKEKVLKSKYCIIL